MDSPRQYLYQHHRDAELRLFHRLGLLPRRFPCPRCVPTTLRSLYVAEWHALRQGFDPRVWRCGPDTFCPQHTIDFLTALVSAARPAAARSSPLAQVYPPPASCPSCSRGTELALYTAAADALCRHHRFLRPAWRSGPHFFCYACEERFLRYPAFFRWIHRFDVLAVRPVVAPYSGVYDRLTERQPEDEDEEEEEGEDVGMALSDEEEEEEEVEMALSDD